MSDLIAAMRARRLDYLLVFVALFSILVYVQYHGIMGDPDGFYHAAVAELLSHGVLLKEMPWMQATTLRDRFTDHHFLYHTLLIPFVKMGNPLMGVKLAVAVSASGFFTMLYWALRRLRGAAPLLFTLILFFSSGFLFRLSLVKANSLSLILLLGILIALFEKRWWLLAALQALYVWLYGGWLVGIIVALTYALTGFVYGRVLQRRLVLHSIFHRLRVRKGSLAAPIVATLIGAVVGIVVNPYWPQNIAFYWQQVWEIAIVNYGASVNVGGEWSRLGLSDFLSNLSYTAFAGALGIGLLIAYMKRMTHRSWTAAALMVVFALFMAKSRRYIELAAPFMVIAASVIAGDALRYTALRLWFHAAFRTRSERRALQIVATCLLIIFVGMPQFGLAARIDQVRNEVMMGIPLERYQPAAEWLAKSTLPQSIVLLSDWDDWPIFFYYNRRNYYLVGLDPTFMYRYDPKLYQDWAALTASGTADDLVDLVDRRLHARFVVIEKDHTAMHETVSNNIYFRLVYEDPEVWVYRYVPAQP